MVRLSCTPNVQSQAPPPCPANPSGPAEPNEIRFTVAHAGTDLDNGWTGASCT